MKSINVYIGSKIQLTRENNNMSQPELAEVIGLSQGSISNIERGKCSAGIDKLFEIAKCFNVSVNHFLPDSKWYFEFKDKKIKKKIIFEIEK